MHHPHAAAAHELDLATGDIAARRYDIAETRLTRLLRRAPDFAEAWHKRAALYYMLGRDAECLHDIARTLELEPRTSAPCCTSRRSCARRAPPRSELCAGRSARDPSASHNP